MHEITSVLPARKACVRCGRPARVGLAVAAALVLVAGCSSAAARPSPAFPPLPGTGVAAGLPPVRARPQQPGRMAGHEGAVTGYNADMFYLPAKNATIIVLVSARSLRFLLSAGEDIGDAAAISIAQITVPIAQATQG